MYEQRIRNVLWEVGSNFVERMVASFDIHVSRDIHGFYRLLEKPNRLVHVQAYPGISSRELMVVRASLMDYGEMIELRRKGIEIGNEHDATKRILRNFGLGVQVPYDAQVLEEMLAESVPELNDGVFA